MDFSQQYFAFDARCNEKYISSKTSF